jgi:hypothetical protein
MLKQTKQTGTRDWGRTERATFVGELFHASPYIHEADKVWPCFCLWFGIVVDFFSLFHRAVTQRQLTAIVPTRTLGREGMQFTLNEIRTAGAAENG